MNTKLPVILLLFMLFVSVCVVAENVEVAIEEIRLAFERHRWNQVESLAAKILTTQPQNSEIHYYLGQAELKTDKIQHALERFNWLCHVKPENADYRFALAMSLHLCGKNDLAKVQASHASNLSPTNAMYTAFLASLTSDVDHYATAPLYVEQSRHEESEISLAPTAYEVELKGLTPKLKTDARATIQLLFSRVESEPEIIADPSWSLVIDTIKRLVTEGKHEVMRRFLLWRSGELGHKDFEDWLNARVVRNLLKNDEAFGEMKKKLEISGFRLIQTVSDEDAPITISWFDQLDSDSREAFMNAHYELAWNFHMQNSASATPLWHYQAGRLALELWQTEGFAQHWLKLANDHLENCIADEQLSNNARVLLAEIALHLARR